MRYLDYLFKIGFKNKFNFIPIILLIGLTMLSLFMNLKAQSFVSYTKSIENNTELMSTFSTQYKQKLQEGNLPKEELKNLQDVIKSLDKNINLNRQSIEYANENNWKDSLTLQLELLENNDIADIKAGAAPDYDNYERGVYNKKASYLILAKNNIAPEITGAEIKGFTFTYRMMSNLFPIIFTLCFIAFISNILCSSFINKVDIEDTFPVNQISWQLKKIGSTFFIGMVFYLSWLVLTFSVASLINGIGSPSYPINLYTNSYLDTNSVFSIMIQAILLQIISILFLVAVVYLIALLTKNRISTFFISIISIIGPVLLTSNLVPFAKFLHLLPTTYFNATSVITNQLAFDNRNPNINFYNGCLILSIFSIIVVLIIVLLKVHHEKQQLFNRKII